MKLQLFNRLYKSLYIITEGTDIPVPGDTIRTKKLEGKVSKVVEGYVYFTTADGRNMKNTIKNCTVIEKLADQECSMCDGDLNEVSNVLLAKYKTAAGKDASAADERGDFKHGDKRFKGIVKATKKQFDNDVKNGTRTPFKGIPGVPVDEGTMSWINRSRPAQDVSYEKVLDRNPQTAHSKVIGEEQLDELSVDKLKTYRDSAKSPESFKTRPLRKLARTVQGVQGANDRIRVKTGDRVGMDKPDRGTYEARLSEFIELDEVDMNQFSDILAKQHKEIKAAPKGKISSIPYHDWEIRYRNPITPGDKVNWIIFNKKGEQQHSGTSLGTKDAVADAESWINSGGGSSKQATKSITIDFNVDFAKEFAPGGEMFYAKIEKYGELPALLFSTEQHEGYKTRSIRTQKDKVTGETTLLPAIHSSPAEANAAGLRPNARYTLGDKEPIDDNTTIYTLIYHSTSQSKTDALRMGRPGLTVATSRDVDEAIDPWHGYTPDDKKANALAKAPKSTMRGTEGFTFSEMVQDAIKVHGLKWAFDYYVRKNGLPPRQFQIFAGLTPKIRAGSPPASKPTPKLKPKPANDLKSTMQGKDHIRFSELVQDNIRVHGLKWAFDYYVRKNGLPPREFQIFAGLTTPRSGAKITKPD